MADVRHIPCGPYVNESERIAVEGVKNKLQGLSSGPWILLSNLNHAAQPHLQSDEIDLVVIGPTGVSVLEIKHWDSSFLKSHSSEIEHEADKVTTKAKRVAGKIRATFNPGFVPGKILLTRGANRFTAGNRPEIRGIKFYGLSELVEMFEVRNEETLSPEQINRAAKLLEPLVKIALDGNLRTFGNLVNLERISLKNETFHRVYRGQHSTRRDRVILHLYDLSASDDKRAEELARREFEVIQRWQKSPLVPNLLDSFQEADGYPGELFYFSLVDPAAPSLEERQKDPRWSFEARINFAQKAALGLASFHFPEDPSMPSLVHRRISPQSLRVRHDGTPLFTDFSLSRIVDSQTITPTARFDFGNLSSFVAPEIHQAGWSVADNRSDIYALCSTLIPLFDDESLSTEKVKNILKAGQSVNPEGRPTAHDLADNLQTLLVAREPKNLELPDPEYWDEDMVIPFQNSRYKILSRLGKGGIGQTFKVVEVDTHSEELYGTYVAKVIRYVEDGEKALKAYRKARAHTTHAYLSVIHEIAPAWEANRFVSLMKWVEGMPLNDLIGVLPLHVEEIGEESTEDLVLRWLVDLCSALGAFHDHGLVHGDVSPKNIIVYEGKVVLTDYDTVASIGQKSSGGNPFYASLAVEQGNSCAAADDIFALAASFYHVLFDRDPFFYNGIRSKERGINWDGIDNGYPKLCSFLDKATAATASDRLIHASDAIDFLNNLRRDKNSDEPLDNPEIGVPVSSTPQEFSEQVVPWLTELLSSYPGSRHGNSETRGLDSSFAISTYVETKLDEVLRYEIENRQVALVILFGNAGDGKTAFLQNLLKNLGVTKPPSARRVTKHRLPDGQQLLVNLDGSAAWNGKGANELLTEVFAPFQQGIGAKDLIHIVAVNSGKLLEWIEEQSQETPFTLQLRAALQGDDDALDPRFRLIDLNLRSLVGGIDEADQRIGADFLGVLLDRLLGKQESSDPWVPCAQCLAQHRCPTRQSVMALRDPVRSPQILARLTDALQACHQRGEIHITARELRAALSYIFFGLHDCRELHSDASLAVGHYADRAFNALSPNRQGELLAELARFDPALDFHPAVDRVLRQTKSAQHLPLASLRRIAYFESELLVGDGGTVRLVVPLFHGKHLDRFRQVPFMNDENRNDLLRTLCLGIARLEDLPKEAFSKSNGVPLRITPRTPTESAFWVIKPWPCFRLEAPVPKSAEGLEVLHTHLHLIYRGRLEHEERLIIGLELFHLLLDLDAGMQLAGTGLDGIFANLEIFTQRLAREDTRELYGWHPANPCRVDRLMVKNRGGRQILEREAQV